MSDFPEVTEHQWPGHSPPPNLWPSASSGVRGAPACKLRRVPHFHQYPVPPRTTAPPNLSQGPWGHAPSVLGSFPLFSSRDSGRGRHWGHASVLVGPGDGGETPGGAGSRRPQPRGRHSSVSASGAAAGRADSAPCALARAPAAGYKAAAPTGSTAVWPTPVACGARGVQVSSAQRHPGPSRPRPRPRSRTRGAGSRGPRLVGRRRAASREPRRLRPGWREPWGAESLVSGDGDGGGPAAASVNHQEAGVPATGSGRRVIWGGDLGEIV